MRRKKPEPLAEFFQLLSGQLLSGAQSVLLPGLTDVSDTPNQTDYRFLE